MVNLSHRKHGPGVETVKDIIHHPSLGQNLPSKWELEVTSSMLGNGGTEGHGTLQERRLMQAEGLFSTTVFE